MPKDNEVDEKVMPVAWVERTEGGLTRMWSGDLSAWAHRPANPEPLYSAATVAELRAEVESERTLRLRAEGLSAQWKQRHDYLLEGANEVCAQRDAAERRVGELEAALSDLISVADPVALAPREYERIREKTARGTCISISIDPFPLLKCRYEDVVDLTDGLKRARAALTGADPT